MDQTINKVVVTSYGFCLLHVVSVTFHKHPHIICDS